MKPFKELDPVLHSQLRLAVMSILIAVKEAEFSFLKEKNRSHSRKFKRTNSKTERCSIY